MLTTLARLLLRPFTFGQIDRWRWNFFRLSRASGAVFFASLVDAWLFHPPLTFLAVPALVVMLATWLTAGVMLLEVERREALTSGRIR